MTAGRDRLPAMVWADPPGPPRSSGWGGMQAFVRELAANPGRWAVWPFVTDAPTSARNAQQRLRDQGCDQGCEARIAPAPDGDGNAVYARWPEPKD